MVWWPCRLRWNSLLQSRLGSSRLSPNLRPKDSESRKHSKSKYWEKLLFHIICMLKRALLPVFFPIGYFSLTVVHEYIPPLPPDPYTFTLQLSEHLFLLLAASATLHLACGAGGNDSILGRHHKIYPVRLDCVLRYVLSVSAMKTA